MFIYTGHTKKYDSNIPLKSIDVNASIVDTFGEIVITQTFQNKYSQPIEAIYCFNLGTNSSVCSMRIIVNGKSLVSTIKEKSQARTEYSTAKIEQKTTCLLELESDGSYKVNLGNIQSEQDIVVELTYVTTLEYFGSFVQFVLPTNIAPKYTDSTKTIKDVISSVASFLTYSSGANYKFTFNLQYKSNNTINCVKSLTNEINVTQVSENEVKVTSSSMPSSGDFNLLIDTTVAPGIYYSTQGDTTYLAVTHKIPDQSLDLMTVQKEYIFVIDRSGSMNSRMNNWSGAGGEKTKMDLAKEALQLFISSLPPQSTFNVYSFGNKYKPMFTNSVAITNDSVREALKNVKNFTSDMGGTQIIDCLRAIFSGEVSVGTSAQPVDLSKRSWKPDPAGDFEKIDSTSTKTPTPTVQREKVLILLTDGQVDNTNAVVELCEYYNYLARVFCIGIGSNVDRVLVRNVSRATNGFSDVLVDNDDVSSSVIKMLDASLKSYYKNVHTSIGSASHVLYPNQSLNFFSSIPTSEFEKLTQITLQGTNGVSGETETWAVPIESKFASPQYLRQLWARDQINSLQNSNNKNANTNNDIIRLSVDHSIASKYTSFVVVDEVVNPGQGGPLTILVPQHSYSDLCEMSSSSTALFGSAGPSAGYCSYGGGSSRRLEGCSQPTESKGKIVKERSMFRTMKDAFSPTSVSKSAPGPVNMSAPRSSSSTMFDHFAYENNTTTKPRSSSSTMFDHFAYENNTTTKPRSSSSTMFDHVTYEDDEDSEDSEACTQVKSNSVTNVDTLLSFKNFDGSFQYSPRVLNAIGVSTDKFNKVLSTQNVSKEYLLNLLVLAYFKNMNNVKFTMIQRMLELWLASNKASDVSESVTLESLSV